MLSRFVYTLMARASAFGHLLLVRKLCIAFFQIIGHQGLCLPVRLGCDLDSAFQAMRQG